MPVAANSVVVECPGCGAELEVFESEEDNESANEESDQDAESEDEAGEDEGQEETRATNPSRSFWQRLTR